MQQSSHQVPEQMKWLSEKVIAGRDSPFAVFNGDFMELVTLLRKLKNDFNHQCLYERK